MRLGFLLFITLFISFGSNAQVIDTEEKLGIEMIKAFQKKDYSSYKSLLLTTESYIQMIPQMRKEMKVPNPEPFLQEGFDFYKAGKLDTLNKILFKEIIARGTSLGIEDWNEISFESFQLLKREVNNNEVQPITGFIYFLYSKKKYIIGPVIGCRIKSNVYLTLARGIGKAPD
jgi:hypothetical protein